MYSYQDRTRAVELYVKLGKRVRATIRQLGYPTKNALKGWHHEYEQHLDLPVGYAGRCPKYSQAQREATVEHYLTHDRCIAATMRTLGFPGRGTLTAWVREALPETRKAMVGTTGRPTYAAIETVVDTNDRPVVHSDRGALYRWHGGSRGSQMRSSFARCLARDARRTTRRAKASSAG